MQGANGTIPADANKSPTTTGDAVPDDIFDMYEKMDRDDDESLDKCVSFEIAQDSLETLQKRWHCTLNVLYTVDSPKWNIFSHISFK